MWACPSLSRSSQGVFDMTIKKLLNQAMLELAAIPNAIFMGQGVAYGGVATFADFEDVPKERRFEWPVSEELQLGAAIGLSLQGYLPITVFPRMDFLLRAADQLVLHLDKIAVMSNGQFRPKVIIRTRVGNKTPLDAGPQHTNDLTDGLRAMLQNTPVVKISSESEVLQVYRDAAASDRSTVVVEVL